MRRFDRFETAARRLSAGWIGAAVLLLVAGCASTPPDPAAARQASSLQQKAPDPLERARAHTELGAAYFEMGNLGVALEELQIAVEARNDYAPAHNMLGLIYMAMRDNSRAQSSFDRALRLSPDDPDVNHNAGWFYCQTGRERESVKFFLDAVKNPLYRTPAKTFTTAGVCMVQAKRTNEAFDFLDRALKLDPAYTPAFLPMARVQMQRGAIEEARELTRRFNSRGSPTAESLWIALLIERRRGDSQSEESLATQLRRRFPDSREAQALQRGQFE